MVSTEPRARGMSNPDTRLRQFLDDSTPRSRRVVSRFWWERPLPWRFPGPARAIPPHRRLGTQYFSLAKHLLNGTRLNRRAI